MQSAIHIGRTCGNINAEKLMPSRQTVKRQVDRDYEKKKRMLMVQLAEIANCAGRTAFQMDLWSCQYTKASYITLVLQSFDAEMKLETTTFCCRQVTTKKVAQELVEVVESILNSFGSSLYLSEHAFTTDEGSNLLKMFELVSESSVFVFTHSI